MADYVTKVRTEKGDLQIDYEALANLPTSDATLTQSGKFADAKAVGDKVTKLTNNVSSLSTEVDELSEAVANFSDNITPEDIGALPDTYEPPVTSVDGKTGAVITGAYTVGNPPPYPVTSVNEQTGDVSIKIGVDGAGEGDIPTFDANGNLTTAGVKWTDVQWFQMSLEGTVLYINTVY